MTLREKNSEHRSVTSPEPSPLSGAAARSSERQAGWERRIELLREWLPDLCDDERLVVFERVTAGYCRECGSKFMPCHCTRDD